MNRLYQRKQTRLDTERLEQEKEDIKRKKDEEVLKAKKAERERMKKEERGAVLLQSFRRKCVAEKKYAATVRGARSGQSMYRVWSARKKLRRKKHQKKERERIAKMKIIHVERHQRKQQRRGEGGGGGRGGHPETSSSSSLKPSLPLIHKKQQQQTSLRPTRGRLRTSGWDEQTLNNSGGGAVFGRVSDAAAAGAAASIEKSRSTSVGHQKRDEKIMKIPSYRVVQSGGGVNPLLPGISNQPNRAGAQSAPALTGTMSSSHAHAKQDNVSGSIDDDSLRTAWTNARLRRDSNIIRQNKDHHHHQQQQIANRWKQRVHQPAWKRQRDRSFPPQQREQQPAKKNGDEGEEGPKWNSLFHIKNQYESNAVSIRNRMLRGIKPTRSKS